MVYVDMSCKYQADGTTAVRVVPTGPGQHLHLGPGPEAGGLT